MIKRVSARLASPFVMVKNANKTENKIAKVLLQELPLKRKTLNKDVFVAKEAKKCNTCFPSWAC